MFTRILFNLRSSPQVALVDALPVTRGRTSELGDEVMQPSSFDLNGVARNPQIVR